MVAALLFAGLPACTSGGTTPQVDRADGISPARYVDGTIMTWDSKSGATRWTAKPAAGRYLEVGAIGRAVVVAQSGRCGDDGLIGGRAVGLDARTGKERWRAKDKGRVVTSDTGSGVIVTSAGLNRIAGVSTKTGERKWELSGELMGSNASTIFVHADAYSTTVQARNRATSRLRWTFELPPRVGSGTSVKVVASNARSTVLASGGFLGGYTSAAGVFTRFAPTTLVTVDSGTGRELHRTVVADPELSFSTGVLRGDVLALINGREINGVNLVSGNIAWRYPVPAPSGNYRGVLSSGVRGRFALYSSPLTRETVALDTTTGATVWSRPLGMVGKGSAISIVLLAPLRTYTREPIEGVDIATGTTRWTRTLRSAYAVPEPSLSQRPFIPMAVACGTP